ncbi:MAG: metallophosphoesterase [Anaerolineae bacterium]
MSSLPSPLRILVVENHPQQREDLVGLLQGWQLQGWRYEVYTAEGRVGADDFYQSLLDDAINKARTHRCHLAIVDMRLKDDSDSRDTSGLALVPQLAPTVSIIYSGKGDVVTVSEALAPEDEVRKDVPLRAYKFIEKASGKELLKKAIEKAAGEIWHRREIEFVSFAEFTCEALAQRLTALGDGEIHADEVEDMLRRLFPGAKRLRIEAVNEAQQKGLSVPRGHSIVVKVTQDAHFSSYVVKLTTKREPKAWTNVSDELTTTREAKAWTNVSDELNRFNRVRPFFTGQRYASVVGSPIRLWNLTGIVYEFLAGDEEHPICSLADYYRDNQAEAINKVLDNIRRLWRRLYETPVQQRKPVFRAYDEAWNEKLSQRLIEFSPYPTPYADVLAKLNLPNPFTWIAQKIALQENGTYQDGGLPDTAFAICHGDLHSENIFTDTRQDVWLIDYERTGEGPLLQDFTELENDILTSLVNLQSTDTKQFAQLVCALIEPKNLIPKQQLATFSAHSEAGKAFEVICGWRELASSVLGVGGGDKRQYYYGLLFNALFRLTLLWREQGDEAFVASVKLSQATRCLILAGMVCHRLDNWTKSWPSQEWEAVCRTTHHSMDELAILHLSDIHLGTHTQAQVYCSQLETDLLDGLGQKSLDYLVLNGDMADKANPGEYDAALWLVERLMKQFQLTPDQIIVVPGNHDVSYIQSRRAYSRFVFDPVADEDEAKRSIVQANGRAICDDETAYEARLEPFADFYQKVRQSTYSLSRNQQAIVQVFPEHKLLFLSLNSAHEVDHFYQQRASIFAPALAHGLDQISADYKDWLKIAVWHHPLGGPEAMNTEFMQQLAVRGFQICMHGHIHEAIEDYHKFDDRLGLRVIGAGTFGAPVRQQTTSIPLQYNLITLNPNECSVKIESRKKEKPEGAWMADARWIEKLRNPQPWYTFKVKWGFCIEDKGGKS